MVNSLKRPGQARPGYEKAFPVEPQLLRDVIKYGEAVYMPLKRFTHEAIIKKIAEQIGGSFRRRNRARSRNNRGNPF